MFWYADRLLPKYPGRWPWEVWDAEVVVIDVPGRLPACHLVWVIGYGPPQRYLGLYEIRIPHDRRLDSRLRNMMMVMLCMAGF